MDEKKRFPVNYVYFGLYFFSLVLIHAFQFLLMQRTSDKLQEFYLSFIFLQSFIEAFFLACIFSVLAKYRKIVFLVILLSLLTLLSFVRLADFVLVRLMDVSAWRWIELVAHETITNFIEMLYASNIRLIIWFTGLIGLLLAIVLNVSFFFVTQNICEKKALLFSFRKIINCCLASFVLLGALDVSCYLSQTSNDSLAYIKTLPWKRTFLPYKEEAWAVSGYLHTPEAFSLNSADSTLFSLERKPDLFLFVVESLRADYLTEEITPNLAQFREDNYCFKNTLANANCTHKSWFSIFYSLYPFYWTKYDPTHWKQGGIPLSLLKKMGYQIHVYASSRLGYYGMDERLFGEKRHLVEGLHEFGSNESRSPADTDQMAVEQLCADLHSSTKKGGRIFILFLDGTHFGYSWPEQKKENFLPISDGLNYSDIIGKRHSIELIQNRYKNALSAIDDLFATFQKTMLKLDMWEDSVVVFTADHGEEFNEFGCMFHASHLSLPQLNIPLYFKWGRDFTEKLPDFTRRASHVDIFPTLLHYLTGEDFWTSCFHGESLLVNPKKDYTLGVRSNASLAPYEFYIQRGLYRATLEFCQREDIFHSRFLKIRSIVDEKEEKVPFSSSFFQGQFGNVLEELFSLH